MFTAPKHVSVDHESLSRVLVTFNTDGAEQSGISFYRAIARESSRSADHFCVAFVTNALTTNCVIDGLRGATEYVISASACFSYNDCGDEAVLLSITTRKDSVHMIP